MNTIEAINCRRSYRGKYKPIPVPREDLTKIMQAGLAAPSGCNKQTTSLIAVELGYQSCWYEGYITDEDKIGCKMAQILGVPDEYELVCFCRLESPKQIPRFRRKSLSANALGSIHFHAEQLIVNS